MAWFKCLVRGENFPLTIDDERAPTGFYTTRYVDAADEADAEMKVVETLRGESALSVAPGTPGMEFARVYVEEIDLVDAPGTPNAGFTFYREE